MCRLAVAVLGAILLTTSALAQTPNGTILGGVKDAQSAVVPGASVTATNLGTQYSRSTVTDGAGECALRLLPVGNYMLVVTLPGFKNYSQTGILIEVGRNARVDATIELGAVSETVSVVGDSPLVDTASSLLSRTVGQNEVLNLPLVNRDLYSLLSITGGVTNNVSSNSLGGPEQLTTINGSGTAQMGTVNFQLDGGNNTAGLRSTGNPAPNPEAVQEFRVLTNDYSAEYGRFSASVVDIVTKSGTNAFHGAAFDFIRNEKLSSPRWAPPGTVGTNDALDRKQFGGPITKGKTFFFASYSGLRQERDLLQEHGGGTDGGPAGGRLLALVDQAERPGDGASVRRRDHSGGALRYCGQDHSGSLRPVIECAQQLLRSSRPGSDQHQRRHAQN